MSRKGAKLAKEFPAHYWVRRFSVLTFASLRLCVTLVFGLSMTTVSGCGYPAAATYGPMDAAAARQILVERAKNVRTVSSQADVVLTRSDGQSVRLDAVLVMRPPDAMHLRAWKLGEAVFDLTITPAGVWLMQPAQPGDATAPTSVENNPAPTSGPFDQPGVGDRLAATWGLLSGGMFSGEELSTDQAIDRGSSFEFRRVQSDGMSIVCLVDKRTITPTLYRLFDADGTERFELALDKYASIGGISWPMQIVARQLGMGSDAASAGTIEVDLTTVELNTDLPDGAFVPPRRARKLP
jgi:hypothetical protein